MSCRDSVVLICRLDLVGVFVLILVVLILLVSCRDVGGVVVEKEQRLDDISPQLRLHSSTSTRRAKHSRHVLVLVLPFAEDVERGRAQGRADGLDTHSDRA